MGDRYIVLGVETVELAGGRYPLCVTCLNVVGDEIEKVVPVLIDWTECFPGPGDRAERRPPQGGVRLSGADWTRALARTGLPGVTSPRDLREAGSSPAMALSFLHAVLGSLDFWKGYLVIHDIPHDLQVLVDALSACVPGPLPDFAVTATAHLELARRHGLRPGRGENYLCLLARVRELGEPLPSLEECLTQHGLDFGVPPGTSYRAMATFKVYQALRRHIPWVAPR